MVDVTWCVAQSGCAALLYTHYQLGHTAHPSWGVRNLWEVVVNYRRTASLWGRAREWGGGISKQEVGRGKPGGKEGWWWRGEGGEEGRGRGEPWAGGRRLRAEGG